MEKEIYERLLLQAEEADSLGLYKIAENTYDVLSKSTPIDNELTSALDFKSHIQREIFQLFIEYANFYNIKDADLVHLDRCADNMTKMFLKEAQLTFGNELISEKELDLPGEEDSE